VSGSGFLAVGLGAALGAWMRWLLSLAFNAAHPSLPLGTLLANLIGGYLIGVVVELLGVRAGIPPEMRLFAVTGFLGGLTTFSTFSAESVNLISRGQYGWALAHTGAHLFGSIVMTALGIFTIRAVHG
jgi:CrcB protein